jgi:DnaJ-class molecular chaperone
MSQIKHTLEIESPGSKRANPECHTAFLVCKACNGKGYRNIVVGPHAYNQSVCQCCNKTGYVIAEIQIVYKPFKP